MRRDEKANKAVQTIMKGQKSRKHWNFSSSRKNIIQLELLFTNLGVEEQATTIRLDYNYLPSIVKFVAQPVFTELLALNLGGNRIGNLQNVVNLQAQKLSSLSLFSNQQIVSIGVLRKARFPNLKIIDLTANKILQANKISQMPSKHIQRVNLDFNQVYNLSYLCKIEGFSGKGIILFNGNHLIQVLAKPAKVHSKTANRCMLINTRNPDINYS